MRSLGVIVIFVVLAMKHAFGAEVAVWSPSMFPDTEVPTNFTFEVGEGECVM